MRTDFARLICGSLLAIVLSFVVATYLTPLVADDIQIINGAAKADRLDIPEGN